jgi:hypothetical protein
MVARMNNPFKTVQLRSNASIATRPNEISPSQNFQIFKDVPYFDESRPVSTIREFLEEDKETREIWKPSTIWKRAPLFGTLPLTV